MADEVKTNEIATAAAAPKDLREKAARAALARQADARKALLDDEEEKLRKASAVGYALPPQVLPR